MKVKSSEFLDGSPLYSIYLLERAMSMLTCILFKNIYILPLDYSLLLKILAPDFFLMQFFAIGLHLYRGEFSALPYLSSIFPVYRIHSILF